MGEAIGESLPMAIGVALSPLPIVAVVLMLATKRARVNGPAFIAGWLTGLAIVGVIVLAVAGPTDKTQGAEPATWVGVTKVVLGGLLVLLAAKQFRDRPQEGEEAELPRWMGALDSFTPPKAAGAGVVLSALNPKNLLLAVGGAATIAATGISGGGQALAYAVFALIGTLGVGAPVAIYFALGDRSAEVLERLRGWMARNNAVIMAVLLLVIGMKLVGDGITAF